MTFRHKKNKLYVNLTRKSKGFTYIRRKRNPMKLSEFLFALNQVESLDFKTPDGNAVPAHFHITEVGKVEKHFVDCGGTERKESVVNFQLWSSNDVEHRLYPQKTINIIRLSQQRLHLRDEEIEVEYQGETIGKFGLYFDGSCFHLQRKFTDCLAKDDCGVPEVQGGEESCCTPKSGCC